MNNLPDGVTASMIPGNSRREMASERAMEEAEQIALEVWPQIGDAGVALVAAFELGPEDAQLAIRKAREALEAIQEKLDDAYNILGRVIDPDEPEYDPSP